MSSPKQDSPYFVPTTSKTLDILEAFHTAAEELTLEQIVKRTGIPHTTAFRILYTLAQRRYVAQNGKRYRLNPRPKKVRVGFGNLTTELPFAQTVGASLASAAAAAGVELLALDNHRDPERAVQNAREMAAAKVDVAIEFQRHAEVAPEIADIFRSAGIPLVAVNVPHPGAIYFGVNNYQCGYAAGEALAEFAREQWRGKADLLILLDIPQGGVVMQSRMTGAANAVEMRLGPRAVRQVVKVGGGGERSRARAAVATILKRQAEAKRILVAACSDDGALGAMDALEQAGRAERAAIVGMEGSPEALARVAEEGSPYLATVAFFPEKYGPALVDLVLRLIRGEQVPPSWHVEHEVIGREGARRLLEENVDR